MQEGHNKIELDELIEKYRFWLGGGLLFLILIGGGLLLWRENYAVFSSEDKFVVLEQRMAQLEKSLNDLKNQPKTVVSAQPESVPVVAPEPGQVAGAVTKSTSTPKISGKVNLNSATLAELDTLTGVGPAYAQRIIDYRAKNGGFKSIDEVKNVKGIGEKTFDKFKDQIGI